MPKINDIQRLEFIDSLQRLYNNALAKQDLQGTRLIEVIFRDAYDLQSRRDIGVLLSNLESQIDDVLKPEMYDEIAKAVEQLTAMGVTHSVINSTSILGNSAFDFMNINTRLATDYLSRVGEDGLRLSERLWSVDQKKVITKEVFDSIEKGESKFQLAQKLEKVVAEGIPKSNLQRIASSEMNYAYSHAKIDTLLAEQELFPEAEAYVKISLSPSHSIFDICDAMEGTYEAQYAPVPPFHPNCTCRSDTILRPSGAGMRTTTLQSSLNSYKNFDEKSQGVKRIETATKVINIK